MKPIKKVRSRNRSLDAVDLELAEFERQSRKDRAWMRERGKYYRDKAKEYKSRADYIRNNGNRLKMLFSWDG